MVLFLISFIAGVLTVLAPCILPLLPVIVGGSLTDGKVNTKKALTIVISLGLSVIAFTLLLKVSTLFINIPPDFWQWFSGGVVALIGLIMIFPRLWEGQIMARLSTKANMALGEGERKGGITGNIIIGASLGPVFSTCSPTYFIVLATVLPVNPALGILYLLAYTVGLCLSLLIVAFLGQKIMARLNVAADPRGWFKKILGIIFLLVGVAIITGADKELQTKILNSGFFDVTKIEQRLLENTEPNDTLEDMLDPTGMAPDISKDEQAVNDDTLIEDDSSDTKKENTASSNINLLSLKEKSAKYKVAPEISTPDGFVNTDGKPITLAELKGKKVVLLDVWTYSCINCQRTLPYLKDWYAKYKDQGLEIIGLHTPEFSFEKVQKNVEEAVKKFGLEYPVVLDNDYSTWNDYGNRYWPRKYLIDIDGFIVYDHIGEGGYTETEKAIQKALMERSAKLKTTVDVNKELVTDVSLNRPNSPETYFGAFRNNLLENGTPSKIGVQNFTAPSNPNKNALYLEGTWNIQNEYAENTSEAKVIFKYEAKDVHFVASSIEGVTVSIYKDGVFIKNVLIKEDGLYTLISDQNMETHTLEIRIPKAGLKAFTFTFG